MVNHHYRWDFIGLSTDEKPTVETSDKVANGSTFYCSDTSKLYVWYKDQWYEKVAEGGGGGGDTEDWGTVTYLDSNSQEKTVTIQNINEYLSLGYYNASSSANAYLTIGGDYFQKSTIVKVALGKSSNFIPETFLAFDTNLQSVTGLENVEYIGAYFLNGCPINFDINLPKVKQILNDFLYNCSSFNSNITLGENLTSIGTSFMSGCQSFNKPLTIPAGVTEFQYGFLNNCSSFNQEFTIGSTVTKVGNNFMVGCTSFAQNFTLPATVTSIGDSFMQKCNNFTGILTLNTPAQIADLPYSSATLSTTSNTAPMYTTGVTITGSAANLWKQRYTNSTASGYYRKLIVAS